MKGHYDAPANEIYPGRDYQLHRNTMDWTQSQLIRVVLQPPGMDAGAEFGFRDRVALIIDPDGLELSAD